MAEKKWSDLGNGMIQCDTTMTDKNSDKGIIELRFSLPGRLVNGEPAAPEGWNVPEFSIGDKKYGLADVYERFLYATDLRERANARESVAVESTVIRVNGVDIDIMKKKDNEIIAAVNMARGLKQLTGKEQGKAFEVAARKMVEQSKAREDSSTGMLVPASGNGQKK